MNNSVVFIDTEIGSSRKIQAIGAIKKNQEVFSSPNVKEFQEFIIGSTYVCGHNIIEHDLQYLQLNDDKKIIDTLYLSPLLFPRHPYHKLLKDDKIFTDELNNPVNDAKKAMDLFYDEVNAFLELPIEIQNIYYTLLSNINEFKFFFEYIKELCDDFKCVDMHYIKKAYKNLICENSDIESFIETHKIESAYAFAIINTKNNSNKSITPAWVLHKYPKTQIIIKKLCNMPCGEKCEYCNEQLNIHRQLEKYFHYKDFRTYEGEPLQEKACLAAVQNKSLIAIFPTGGGKSLTFQLPALIAGDSMNGLTVVISPLQSLMKDQIDNLEKRNIVNAVSINGLLSQIERSEAFERVKNGIVSLLYLSPEQLRSVSIEKLLLTRNIVRFVIDEAHCFSAWGQDFRVDYLYIGTFIKKIQEKKNENTIEISCFTATAKQKVIMDIYTYFQDTLGRELELYASSASRENLQYKVLFNNNDEEKYQSLRSLIEAKNCSAIVYVNTVKKTVKYAQRLTQDGFDALPFNGKMEAKDKVETQEKFINDTVKIIVATSAFGMGVDKQNIELVIHFDIPSSLEDYMQESGRAAREQSLQAECYILFSPHDVDSNFTRLNQSKLSMNEIQQVWQAVKRLTKNRKRFTRSALEIAREAGWDNLEISVEKLEVKVKTAILALEKAGYIIRGQNMPVVYATSIQADSVNEAQTIMNASSLFDEKQYETSTRIISNLISSKKRLYSDEQGESRVDVLSDTLGLEKRDIVNAINLMKEVKLLTDHSDMTAQFNSKYKEKFKIYRNIEKHIIDEELRESENIFSLKKINEILQTKDVKSQVKDIRTIFNFWKIKSYIDKSNYFSDEKMDINLLKKPDELLKLYEKRINICSFILAHFEKNKILGKNSKEIMDFSMLELLNGYKNSMFFVRDITQEDIEDALLYLHKGQLLSLEGGFLVFYSSMEITRLEESNKVSYKKEDYKFLGDYYKQKVQQIHIISELLNMIVKNYTAALQFIKDYFQLEYKSFIGKYFKGRSKEIEINMTTGRYQKLFASLSDIQKNIIEDSSKNIVVLAGPGSGKTRILVHKLASLLTLEDIKSEQLLMLTFSRAAAMEFKSKLIDLIGKSAYYVEIKTFHSFCFDITGRHGSLETSENIVKTAVEMINSHECEAGKISKMVLVIDEAQDMSEDEFLLVKALIDYNENIRIIAVGDDDQNIYEFRGAKSQYFLSLLTRENSKKFEMVENFRSCEKIVEFSNTFALSIKNRMKENLCVAKKDSGLVHITKCRSKNLEIPLVNAIRKRKERKNVCILTNTNNEALRVLGLLQEHQISARLIQSLNNFKLSDLLEIHNILTILEKEKDLIQISEERWKRMINYLRSTFAKSSCMPTVCKMLNEFEKVSSHKYFTDLKLFFTEAKYEDFYTENENIITVSTLHKSKGHEYDAVYMLLNSLSINSDEEKRKLYVGMTRAKNELFIHCNNAILDNTANMCDISYDYDSNEYASPKSLLVQLTHKDVILDNFIGRKNQIEKMRSGDVIHIESSQLFMYTNQQRFEVKLSRAFRENVIENLRKQGYAMRFAQIHFIVYWQKKDSDIHTPIILPEIKFEKMMSKT